MAQAVPNGGMAWDTASQQYVPTYTLPASDAGVKVSIPRRPSPMPELGHIDQQGRELFNTVSQSPFAQIATNYGKDMLKNSKISSYFSLEPLKYYFNVSNSYVLNKLKVLLLPFLQKRQVVRKDEMEFFCPPRDDVNAPDLYIPVMAFVTYILLVGFIMGSNGLFNPEMLGSQASKGIVTMFLEVLFVRSGLYFFENTVEVSLLDIIAYCSYIFVPVILNLVSGFVFGSLAYYVSLILTGVCFGFFLVRTMRLVVLPDQGGAAKRQSFLLSLAALQLLLAWFLGILL